MADGVFSMWGVEDTALLRDVEAWSGKMGVAIKGVNNSGGQVASASFSLNEHARTVLQSEDIRAVHHGRQILRVGGNHLFVADRVPWFAVPRWQPVLRDVRQLHHAAADKVITPDVSSRLLANDSRAALVRRLTHQL